MADKFADKTEYMASLRDKSRIEAITSQVDVKDPKVAGELYRRLKARPSYFETETGRRFLKNLYVTSEGAKRMNMPAPIIPDEPDDFIRPAAPTRGKIAEDKKPADKHPADKKSADKRPATSKITIIDGPETLKEKYNALPAGTARENERMRAIDELTSARREYNEFWDDPDAAPAKDPAENERKRKRLKRLLFASGVAAAIMLGILLGNEVAYRIENSRSLKKMAELQSVVNRYTGNVSTGDNVVDAHAAVPTKPESNETDSEPTEAPVPVVLPEYAELYARNNDMVGWIRIPDTIVNYPVMQTLNDMEYYLLRDFDGKDDKNGLPFVDSRANVFEPSTNVLIYGHSMKNGAMFAALLNYKDKAYYERHPVIYFDTLYEHAEYEIIACFQSRVAYTGEKVFRYYSFIDAQTEEEYDDFVKNIKEMSYYDIPATAVFGDSLITLSTCDREITNGRMVVVARKISK